MKILYEPVLQSIYARSALHTLPEQSAAPLLHPDHEPALRVVLRDLAMLLEPHLPRGISVTAVDTDGIELAGDVVPAVARAVEAALAAAAIDSVVMAAGGTANVINTLVENFSTSYQPAVIRASMY